MYVDKDQAGATFYKRKEGRGSQIRDVVLLGSYDTWVCGRFRCQTECEMQKGRPACVITW